MSTKKVGLTPTNKDEEEEEEDKNNNNDDDNDDKNVLKNVDDNDMLIESDDEQQNDNVLNLACQNLTEIPTNLAKQRGPNVTTLILTKNKLQSLKNLEHFPNVETLQLDRNLLTNINDFPKLIHLKILWLNNNHLENIETLLNILKKNCPKLEYLSLLRNPLCPSIYFDHGNENRYKRFRLMVLFNLPTITYLDTNEVTNEERAEANTKGKYLQIAKPNANETQNDDTNNNEEINVEEDNIGITSYKHPEPAAFLGKGRIKYDGRDSEGNRFVLDQDL